MKSVAARRFVRNRAGASMPEYCVLLGLVALILITSVVVLGRQARREFGNSATLIANVNEPDALVSAGDAGDDATPSTFPPGKGKGKGKRRGNHHSAHPGPPAHAGGE